MSYKKHFPDVCIKCQRLDVEIIGFPCTKTKAGLLGLSDSFQTITIYIPVCKDCEYDFNRFIKAKKRFLYSIYAMIGFLALSFFAVIFTFFLGFGFSGYGLNPIQIFCLILSLIMGIISLFMLIPYIAHPARISKYIRLKMNGDFSIKDPQYIEYTRDYIKSKLINEMNDEITGINMISCPKCGSHQHLGTDFCRACGKNLKN